MSQEKLREKLAHVRGELRRARARIKELEGRDAGLAQLAQDALTYGIGVARISPADLYQGPPRPPKPPGYEHLSRATIKAIAETCSSQADRAGQTQDEVFRAKGTP